MSVIQILLIGSIVILTCFFFIKLKRKVIIKCLLIFSSMAGIYFTLFPEHTTLISRKLGVGRGADLIVYFFIVAVFFTLIGFYARLRLLQEQITVLIREKAISEACILGKEKDSVSN